MAGHSKWANIKRRKEKVDAQRGKIFTKVAREIIVAARQGGGDPETNFRLKAAITRAKEANLPNDNIIRAIKRGTGDSAADALEEIIYEGYGPGGVAVLMNVVTDNRNRTVGEIRHIFSRSGGNLGESGCVSWMFEQKGLILLEKDAVKLDEDEVMMLALEAGAEDLKTEEDSYEIITSPSDFNSVQDDLVSKGVVIAASEITMIPKTYVELEGKQADQMLRLIDALEDHDDIQEVSSNFSEKE